MFNLYLHSFATDVNCQVDPDNSQYLPLKSFTEVSTVDWKDEGHEAKACVTHVRISSMPSLEKSKLGSSIV